MPTKIEALNALANCVKGKTHQDYQRVTKLAEKYKILITGEDIEKLMRKFSPREDEKLFEQRKRISQAVTPAVSEKIISPFEKVSRLDNVDVRINHDNDTKEKSIKDIVHEFHGEETLTEFMDTRFKELTFSDPNAWIVVEKDAEENYYPLEVSSAEAVDFKYYQNKLVYLCIKQQIEYLDAKGKKKTGHKYTIYLNDGIYRLTQVSKDSSKKAVKFNEETESGVFVAIGNQYFIYESFSPDLKRVQSRRVGYKRDLVTEGRTFVNPFQAAVPRFMKTIKSVSELDLTISLHTFPQKIQYVQPCAGTPSHPCKNGKTLKDETCSVCNGSGIISHTSSADTIDIPMPRNKEDMIDLNGLMVYKSPDINLIKFQEEYTSKLEDEALKDVFSTDAFIKTGLENTATGKIVSMQSVYDTVHPYATNYSKMYRFIVETIADYEDIDGLNVFHKFPKDFKMKSVNALLADLKEANDANAPNFLKVEIAKDIASKVYQDNQRELKKHKVKSEHLPFIGKSNQDIQYIVASGLTTKEDAVLWAEFDRIFAELEIESFNDGKKDFYERPFDERKQMIDEKVSDFIAKINGQQQPENIFPSDTE